MSAKPTRRLPPVAGKTGNLRLSLQTFARTLHTRRVELGMSQSDLARAIWGETVDTRGRTVARNRDRISQYEKGASYPEPQNLKLLAEALRISPEELAPDLMAASVDREHPRVRFTVVSGHDEYTHLEVNALLPVKLAIEIAALVANAPSPDQGTR